MRKLNTERKLKGTRTRGLNAEEYGTKHGDGIDPTETLGRQEIQNKVKPKTELDLKQNLRISKNPEQNLKPSLHHILEMLLQPYLPHALLPQSQLYRAILLDKSAR